VNCIVSQLFDERISVVVEGRQICWRIPSVLQWFHIVMHRRSVSGNIGNWAMPPRPTQNATNNHCDTGSIIIVPCAPAESS